jgi:hypothetical protein
MAPGSDCGGLWRGRPSLAGVQLAGPERPSRDAPRAVGARSEMWGAPLGGWAPSRRGEGAALGAAGALRSPFESREPGSLATKARDRWGVGIGLRAPRMERGTAATGGVA